MKKNAFYFSIFIFFLMSEIIAKKKKSNPKKSETEDRIPSILMWAKNNNIYINENLILNKNIDSSHNFFYFTSKSIIKNNTILLKIPYDIMISQTLLNDHFHETKNKKWSKIWDEVAKSKSPYIIDFLTKQIFYISIIIENAINRKKGTIYKKYESYFDMYDYINMDNYPAFYEQDEINFLSSSNFGAELMKLTESLKEEHSIITKDLKITTSMLDTYLKYRILTMGNSISFNNEHLKNEKNYDYNETVVVPFIDCFNKVIFKNESAAEYFIKKDKNNKYYIEVVSNKIIEKGSEINLKWLELSNQDSLLFYGFIEEKNDYAPAIYINVFNNLFKKDLGVKNKNYDSIAKVDLYELNSESFQKDVIESYKNISQTFPKYKDKAVGKYMMMMDNLKYYLNIYDDKYTDRNINLYFTNKEKNRCIKEIMKMEKKIIKSKIKDIKDIIKNLKQRKKKDHHSTNDL